MPSFRAATGDLSAKPTDCAFGASTSAGLPLDEAKKLYAKFANKDGDDAVRAMAEIALVARSKAAGWGRLRLEALRALGRFLIRNGRPRGRPAKTSADEHKLSLVGLGITDHHLSADAKSVARISQKDFDRYLAEETEPTLKGLQRFAEHTRIGQPYPKMGLGPFGKAMHPKSSSTTFSDDDHVFDDFEFALSSTVEWYTPPELFEAMEMMFDLDVASPGAHIVPWIPAKRHLTRRDNGLVADWGDAFVFMNCPYGLRNGCEEWVKKFVAHGNGVAILPDFTSTEWWHIATRDADAIMFVRPKVYFLPKREDGRTNSLGSTLVAMGGRGVQALRNAERNGRGLCFRPDTGAGWRSVELAA
jgi:hypothetical protein